MFKKVSAVIVLVICGLGLIFHAAPVQKTDRRCLFISDAFITSLRPYLEPYYCIHQFRSHSGPQLMRDIGEGKDASYAHRPVAILGLDHRVLLRSGYNVFTNPDFSCFCYQTYCFTARSKPVQTYNSLKHFLYNIPDRSLTVPDPRFSNTGLAFWEEIRGLDANIVKLLAKKINYLAPGMVPAYMYFKKGGGEFVYAYDSTYKALGLSREYRVNIASVRLAVVYLCYFRCDTAIRREILEKLRTPDVAQALKNIAYMEPTSRWEEVKGLCKGVTSSKNSVELRDEFTKKWLEVGG